MNSEARTIKVAVLVTYFPSLSQTFIALQLAALTRIPGCQLDIYSFGPAGDKQWLPKGTEFLLDEVPVHYYDERVKRVSKLRRYLYILFRKPRALIQYVFLGDRPERIKTAVNDHFFLANTENADIVLCQFATIANKLVQYRKYHLWDGLGHLTCAVRGFDISRTDLKTAIYWEDMFSHVALFLPVCEYFSKQLRALGCSARIALCPSPVNTSLLQEKAIKMKVGSSLQLLSVGRLVEKKGIDVALKSCQKLKASGLEFFYHIIGEGPLLDSLKALSKKLDIDDVVKFYGALPSNEVMAFYESVDLMLVPSKTAANGDSEGIPNVLKEAMAVGVPVVSTRHSGIPELVLNRETGFLCDEGSEESLYAVLRDVFDDRESLPVIIDNARQKVLSEYEPDHCARELFRVFVELMSDSKRGSYVS